MLKTKMRKMMSILLTFSSVLMMFNATGCKKNEVVEYYPETVVAEDTGSSEEKADTSKDKEENEFGDDETGNYFVTYDSIDREGKFVYNPTLLHPMYRDQVKSNPKIAKVVVKFLQAIHDCEEEVELTEDEQLKVAEQGLAETLLFLSNPIVEGLAIEPVDESYTKFQIKYFPSYNEANEDGTVTGVSHELAEERIHEFEDYITNTINENIKPEHTNEERAHIIYNVLLEDFDMMYPDLEKGGMLEYYNSGDSATEEMYQSLAEMVHNRRLHPLGFLLLYDYFMAQLDVDCLLVGARGRYQAQQLENLDQYMQGSMVTVWAVVTVDEDVSYNCDLLFDKYAYDEEKERDENAKPDPRFFGMSDTTRNKSFDVIGKQTLFTINPAAPMNIPVCKEDLKK